MFLFLKWAFQNALRADVCYELTDKSRRRDRAVFRLLIFYYLLLYFRILQYCKEFRLFGNENNTGWYTGC